MRSHVLRTHVRAVRDGYASARKASPTSADRSWYAHQGYEVAGRGRPGAGHLAWERVARRFHELRHRAGGSNEDQRLAFVMGYGLGLSDHGRTSIADAEQIIEAVSPRTAVDVPIFRSMRFWLMVALVLTAELSLVGAAENAEPDYPVLTAPLLTSTVAGPSTPALRQTLAAASAQPPRDLGAETAQGLLSVQEAIIELRALDGDAVQAAGTQLLGTLAAPERINVVESFHSMPGPAWTALLVRALEDADGAVVKTALAGLVARGAHASAPQIAKVLNHADIHARRTATEAMGILAGPDAAWQLIAGLSDPDVGVQRSSRRALVQLLGRDYGADSSAWWPHVRKP